MEGSERSIDWQGIPNLPRPWRRFTDVLLSAHPNWKPFLLGPRRGYAPAQPFGGGEWLVFEMPAAHPTIHDPLWSAVGRNASSWIACAGCGHYSDCWCRRDHDELFTLDKMIRQAIRFLEDCVSEQLVFFEDFELRKGEPAGYGLFRLDIDSGLVEAFGGDGSASKSIRRSEWSWRGTHDRTVIV